MKSLDHKLEAIGHMAIDKIKFRAVGEEKEVNCPVYVKIHLIPEKALNYRC